MTDKQTISWIFLAIALASEVHAADFKSISNIADGINHAVPTQQEMKKSILFLTNNALVSSHNKTFELTQKGKEVYQIAKEENNKLFEIWRSIENLI